MKVRNGSLADIASRPRHVRFTPNNGRWTEHPSQHFGFQFMRTRPSKGRCLYLFLRQRVPMYTRPRPNFFLSNFYDFWLFIVWTI